MRERGCATPKCCAIVTAFDGALRDAESARILRTPLADLLTESWPPTRSADLRAFAIATLERHLERRLRSAIALNRA